MFAPLLLYISSQNTRQLHYALSLPCDWLDLHRSDGRRKYRIWWPTSDRVRVYFVPLKKSGTANFPRYDFHVSWIDSSKLPSENIMPDPPHFGEYPSRYMIFFMQIRFSNNKYCLINGMINLWHWHRMFPDYLTEAQAKEIRTKHRLFWLEDNYDKGDGAYIYQPPGQLSTDPRMLYLQFPPLPKSVIGEVQNALASLTVVPKRFEPRSSAVHNLNRKQMSTVSNFGEVN